MTTFPADLAPDDALAAMLASLEGDPVSETAVHVERRDAMVAWARERCPAYRRNASCRAFEEIPILTRQGVRELFGGLLADGVPAERLVRKTTSGSTGSPLLLFRDALQGPLEDLAGRRALERLHGVPDCAVMIWLSATPQVEPSWNREVRTISALHLRPERIAEEVRAWGALGEFFLYGYASGYDWLAGEIEERGLSLERAPACVITTSDALTRVAAHHIGRVFRAPVRSWYGSHELNGFLAGTVPGTDGRYVFNPYLCWAEVVDGDGLPAGPGKVGRLVVTDLNNRAFPLLRYETGDLAVASGGRHGGWQLVERIEGRSSEVLHLPDGRILSAVSLGQLLFVENDFTHLVRAFRCAQVVPGRFELRVNWTRPPHRAERCSMAEVVSTAFGVDAVVVDGSNEGRPRREKAWVVRSEL